MKRVLASLIGLAALAMCAGAAECPAPASTVLAPVHIVDVETGRIRRDRALVLSNRRIAEELAAERVTARTAPEAQRVDGRGAYVIPGLWDMHVHALWDPSVPEAFFRLFLAQGVTAVRDMGGDIEVALASRARIAACPVQAPHVWFAGPFVDGPEPVDPSLSIALKTPADGRAAVQLLRRKGVDFVKVYSLLPADAFAAVIDEAARQGLPVAGHLPAAVKPDDPAARRMASIEHLAIEIGGLCAPDKRAACGPIFAALVRARVAQTPTLVAREVSTRMAEAGFVEPASFAAMPDAVKTYWRREAEASVARATDAWRAARAASLAHARLMTRELALMKATILAGSDAGTPFLVPGESLRDELAFLVAAGLSPYEALRAATLNPARFMGCSDLGVVAPGALADLVLLSGNPLEDIRSTRAVVAVYRGGLRVSSR